MNYCTLETTSGFEIQIINSLICNLDGYASLGWLPLANQTIRKRRRLGQFHMRLAAQTTALIP